MKRSRTLPPVRVVLRVLIFCCICVGALWGGGADAATNAKGTFHLVGIGPGDVDLLTTRALTVIRQADVVFCARKNQEMLKPLVNFDGKEVLTDYRLLFRFYGKRCEEIPEGERTVNGTSCEAYHRKQTEFVALVRTAIGAGKRVVVLSSGDPTLYGPDVWCLRALSDLNPVVVPGISAFNAANAALQARLGEVILTAPFQREGRTDTIEALAGHQRATLVVFMPRDMKALFARLAKVYAPDTPAAIVCSAGMAGAQKVVSGTVAGFAADQGGIDSRLAMVYVGGALAEAGGAAGGKGSPEGKGKFYLVGMGPGDSDLASLRALSVIEKADLIFAGDQIVKRFESQLAGKKVLTGYHRLFPFHGKACADVKAAEATRERMSCEEYHRKQAEFASLARAAMARGKTVAMLDSGDPMVYGPCAWTLSELSDVNTEVVPGLSCFNAANAAVRAGVTEGKNSHSVILASGWSVEEMAAHQTAMVLFTMRTDFKHFIEKLSHHYAPETPVAIVASAGYADKEAVTHSTLGTVLFQAGEKRLPFEYMLYVGDFLENSVGRISSRKGNQ